MGSRGHVFTHRGAAFPDRPLGLRGEQHWFSNQESRSFRHVLGARQSPKQRSWCLRQEEEAPWAVTSA